VCFELEKGMIERCTESLFLLVSILQDPFNTVLRFMIKYIKLSLYLRFRHNVVYIIVS